MNRIIAFPGAASPRPGVRRGDPPSTQDVVLLKKLARLRMMSPAVASLIETLVDDAIVGRQPRR